MQSFGRETRDESGAVLVMALVFVVAMGLIIGVLTNLAGTNLTDTVQLQGQRGTEYAASGTTEAEIQALRYLGGAAGGNNGSSSPQVCQPFPAPPTGSGSTTSSGLTISEDATQYVVAAACQAFPATTIVSVNVQNLSSTITAAANTFSVADIGQMVEAVGIPAGATIIAVASDTSATLSVSAGATACPTASPCAQSVTIATPVGQRIVLLRGCLGLNSGMNCAGGSPVVKAVVRYFDIGSDGKSHVGAGLTVQNWLVQAANG